MKKILIVIVIFIGLLCTACTNNNIEDDSLQDGYHDDDKSDYFQGYCRFKGNNYTTIYTHEYCAKRGGCKNSYYFLNNTENKIITLSDANSFEYNITSKQDNTIFFGNDQHINFDETDSYTGSKHFKIADYETACKELLKSNYNNEEQK